MRSKSILFKKINDCELTGKQFVLPLISDSRYKWDKQSKLQANIY